MRIDPNVVVLPVATTKSQDEPARKAEDRKGAVVVSLSAGATAATQERPEVSADARLERIRALVDRGEYPIDLDKLAQQIVEDDLLRGGA